jgi:hypothetical protein
MVTSDNEVAAPDDRTLLNQAKALLEAGRLSESETLFGQIPVDSPLNAEAFYGLGVLHMHRGELEKATICLKESIAHDPGNANAVYQLGVIAEHQRSWVLARERYARALALDPTHAAARKKLAAAPPRQRIKTSGSHGVWDIMLNESSPAALDIIAHMDELSMRVHPRFSAYLGRLILISAVLTGLCAALPSVQTILTALPAPIRGLRSFIPTPAPPWWQAAVIICVVVFVVGYMYTQSLTIIVANGRLQIVGGPLGWTLKNYELFRVDDVGVHRSLLNRLTGDGSLRLAVVYSGGHSKNVKIVGIASDAEIGKVAQDMLNLVFLLRTHAAIKGIIAY